MAPTLVIGYGNELRGDDAAGPRAAELIRSWELPGIDVHVAHQLLPELAAVIADADSVFFLDAARDQQQETVEIQPVQRAAGAGSLGHAGTPQHLLALTHALYQRSPPAWLLTIPTRSFQFGEPLSARAAAAVHAAAETIRRISQKDPNPS